MSWLEWWGESMDPGGLGSVEMGGRPRGRRSRLSIAFCTLLSLAMIGGLAYLLLVVFQIREGKFLAIAAGATLLYVILGYFVHPEPDYDNMGWLGWVMDNPFRYTDDLNRTLGCLAVVLWPGRLIAESFVDCWIMINYASGPRQKVIRLNRD